MEISAIQNEIKNWKSKLDKEISTSWRSPSNIALLKYWGKRQGQLPLNPSLSFSLSEAHTTTKLTAVPDAINAGISSLNKDIYHPFLNKIHPYWQYVINEIPLLQHYSIAIETENTFPHSAGIASSASGFSALATALLDLAQMLSGNKLAKEDFYKNASSLARMGSGSACRSVYGGFTLWGKSSEWPGSSDLYAIDINAMIHPSFRQLHDAILLVSAKEKSLSSSHGHSLMNEHPFAAGRLLQANNHLELFRKALAEGDLELLSQISENEALSLHALIMSSKGGSILLEPSSLVLIQRIRAARQKGLAVFFTIDAGPNIHMIYPESEKEKLAAFIHDELSDICQENKVIFDFCGKGAVKMNENV
ncbi:MAG: diphosphomevalonate decarboxylase [Bacteroidetes bacterium]|nr:diphosphomevalonate decarboxylase [Bacteroidota bacterium]